jgi:hypothetical protein
MRARDSDAFGGLASAADVPGVRNLDHASSSTYGARTPRVRLITSWPPRTNRGTRKLPTCPLPPIITMRTIPDISYQQTGSAHTPLGGRHPERELGAVAAAVHAVRRAVVFTIQMPSNTSAAPSRIPPGATSALYPAIPPMMRAIAMMHICDFASRRTVLGQIV